MEIENGKRNENKIFYSKEIKYIEKEIFNKPSLFDFDQNLLIKENNLDYFIRMAFMQYETKQTECMRMDEIEEKGIFNIEKLKESLKEELNTDEIITEEEYFSNKINSETVKNTENKVNNKNKVKKILIIAGSVLLGLVIIILFIVKYTIKNKNYKINI